MLNYRVIQGCSKSDRFTRQDFTNSAMGVTLNVLHRRILQVLDAAGDWVSLGGVDLQINGA